MKEFRGNISVNIIDIFTKTIGYAIGGFIIFLIVYSLLFILIRNNDEFLSDFFDIFMPLSIFLGALIGLIKGLELREAIGKIQAKKITFGLVLNWIFVIIFGLLGFVFALIKAWMLANPLIIITIIILPTINELIEANLISNYQEK